jgi:alanine racemase
MPSAFCCLEGFFTRDELPEISHHRLAVVVHNEAQLRMLERTRLEQPIEVFVKINSGMNRLGIAMTEGRADGSSASTTARRSPCCALMTHFARADEDYGIEKPLAAFNAACRGCRIRARLQFRRRRRYPRSAARSCGPASCSTERRRSRPSRPLRSACGR